MEAYFYETSVLSLIGESVVSKALSGLSSEFQLAAELPAPCTSVAHYLQPLLLNRTELYATDTGVPCDLGLLVGRAINSTGEKQASLLADYPGSPTHRW